MKKISTLRLLVIITAIISSFSATSQTAGDNDSTFNPTDIGFGFGDGVNNDVLSSAIQSDGKILIGGRFTTYNGQSISGIIRLNDDETLDKNFNILKGMAGSVNAIAIQSDGKIIIGGSFGFYYKGKYINDFTRLNTDGSLDSTFNTGTGPEGLISKDPIRSSIHSISIQKDGKIVIGGFFLSYNGIKINSIARVNMDGALDKTFNPGKLANDYVLTTAIQNDGKIIMGGHNTSDFGNTRPPIARLNIDGSLDTTFITGTGLNSAPHAIVLQDDLKIIVGGTFTSYNGTSRNGILRLNTDGSIDPTFDPGTGIAITAGKSILTTSLQKDGKILIGGFFTEFNGITKNNIARLNPDGSIDKTFNTGTAANAFISTITAQNNGKIIVGGFFSSFNGVAKNHITTLNPDGSVVIPFNIGTGANSSLKTTLQSDGKILIFGSFTSYNGLYRSHIARLNPDGSIDKTFDPGVGTGINEVIAATAQQVDGKIIIAGDFTSFNGTPVHYITRLNANGSLDPTFHSTGTYKIHTVTIQPDGKILIGGNFSSFNSIPCSGIVRINADGSFDSTFTVEAGFGFQRVIQSIVIQNDNKILIGGTFTSYNGVSRNSILRLNTDGSVDQTFNPGTGVTIPNWDPFDALVYKMVLQKDGKIIVSGVFNYYNGVPRNCIARVNPNGSLDETFNPGTGANYSLYTPTIYATAIQNDGKIIIGGSFTSFNGIDRNHFARLNDDGSLDTTFHVGNGTNPSLGSVRSAEIVDNEKILIGGDFTSYKKVGRNRIARVWRSTVVTKIKEIDNKEVPFTIYPNPANNELTVLINKRVNNATLRLISITGQILQEETNLNGNKFFLNISQQAKGFYIIEVDEAGISSRGKLVKE